MRSISPSGNALRTNLYGRCSSPLLRSFMSLSFSTNCWVCGELLGAGDIRQDEFGFCVHDDCFRRLTFDKTNSPAKPAPKKPDT